MIWNEKILNISELESLLNSLHNMPDSRQLTQANFLMISFIKEICKLKIELYWKKEEFKNLECQLKLTKKLETIIDEKTWKKKWKSEMQIESEIRLELQEWKLELSKIEWEILEYENTYSAIRSFLEAVKSELYFLNNNNVQ